MKRFWNQEVFFNTALQGPCLEKTGQFFCVQQSRRPKAMKRIPSFDNKFAMKMGITPHWCVSVHSDEFLHTFPTNSIGQKGIFSVLSGGGCVLFASIIHWGSSSPHHPITQELCPKLSHLEKISHHHQPGKCPHKKYIDRFFEKESRQCIFSDSN